jgi:hypothetical protein
LPSIADIALHRREQPLGADTVEKVTKTKLWN